MYLKNNMKAFLKTTFFSMVPITRLPAGSASILKYHSIGESTSPLSVPPHLFAKQMQYLADCNIPVMSLSDLVARLRERKDCGGAVVITFDDGYRDNYSAALPLLQKHGFPATLFMITDLVGATENGHAYLSAGELRAMADSGVFEIGSHTQSHPRLDRLSPEGARTEVQGSKAVLEDLLGREVRFMAYPWGAYAAETPAIVERCGLDAAVGVDEGTVSTDSPLYTLPRNSIQHSTSMTQFRGNVSTAIDSYIKVRGCVLRR
ncbi:polysaccharide deacetylase family protein [Geomonas sp. RF6]|uniref:polysaccharide deacetylase family protein n=1 Tax=Geomonas sp. RF6 TaxID=2897342 RepID=UPI001E3BF41A|nr:polysaccharide deacetylase family protein [Geomonas sp. RF6]UFS70351.1 polysaccharide deacetylase family protein [Geomonas sp. RF6]